MCILISNNKMLLLLFLLLLLSDDCCAALVVFDSLRAPWLSSLGTAQVMMLDVAQHVMSFLHKHDRPPVSLHQEMVMRQQELEHVRKMQLEAEEQEWRLREVEEVSGKVWVW